MSKQGKSSGIKLERKKVSPDVLKRMDLFSKALNLKFDKEEGFEGEAYEECLSRIQKMSPERKRTKTTKQFIQEFGVSLDYNAEDIIEVALFKAAMYQDQEKFSALVHHSDLLPKMKNYVLSYSVLIACGFRDIEVVSFLAKNMKNITKLVIITEGVYEEACSPFGMIFDNYCNTSFLDRELIELLFDNGFELNQKMDIYSPYSTIVNLAPEEFAIKMLDHIQDINEVQYERVSTYNHWGKIGETQLEKTYYILQAIEAKKFKLAIAMIKMGAKTDMQNGSGYDLLNMALIYQRDNISEDALEFIKYLFENQHVSSLVAKHFEFGIDLLKFYEVAKLIVTSGIKIEGLTKEDTIKYNQIKAKIQFEQRALADIEIIKIAHAECNEDSIKDSFLPKKTVDSMMKYYLQGYKSKFKEQIEEAESKFFDDLAGMVIKHIKNYTQENWPQTFNIAKTLVINNSNGSEEAALNIPQEIIGEIGEYVFWLDVLDGNSI